MTIKKLTQLLSLAIVLLCVSVITVTWLSGRAVDSERHTLARQAEFKQLGLDLETASDFLTNEARRYAVFGDKRHFDAYWREVNDTKTRDRVVERLKVLGASQAELNLIEQAKKNSDALIATEEKAMKAVAAKDLELARQLMFNDEYDRNKQVIVEPIAAFQKMMNGRAAAEAAAARSHAELLNIVAQSMMIVMALAVGSLLFFFFGRYVVAPIASLTDVVKALAGGKFDIVVPGAARKDEIGVMANAMLVFKENMIKAKEAAHREAEELKVREARTKAIGKLTDDFDANVSMVLKTVASATTEMQATASSMTATAEETSRQATAVAAAAEQASTNVQTVASSAEELSSSISEISRQVANSAKIAAQAVDQANRTNTQVESLAEGAQKIGDVVKMINDIAGQTNLLALNATIEAARAGDAGKGFAVVASEVKSLANQTAKATEDISTQIAGIQSATQESVAAIKEIGKTIAEINQIATAIASAVEEQGVATQEIARNVQQASKGTGEVTSNISGVNQAATDTGAAASQVLSSSAELSKQSETLRGQVETFLSAVKAA